MARMLDLMRQSAVPANIMRTASRGALSVPPAEMIEILVYLAGHPIFGQQASMTLAGWDEADCLALAADPGAPADVLNYWLDPQNQRPRLLPALLQNPAVPEERLIELAGAAKGDALQSILESARVLGSEAALRALSSNPNLSVSQLDKVGAAIAALPPLAMRSRLAAPPRGTPPANTPPPVEQAAAVPAAAPEPPAPASAAEEEVESVEEVETAEAAEPALTEEQQRFLAEHAAEIAAEEGKPFELVGGAEEESAPAPAAEQPAAPDASLALPEPVPEGVGKAAGSAGVAVLAMQKSEDASAQRESTLQKIARLSVGDRVQLAMKGNKDERFILIRDGSKVVSSAVLESPKVTDTEVEGFAAMKNVQESVLRGIAGKRKFMKNYNVVKALVNNPRCPLDLGLTLIKNLTSNDLNALSKNKNVADTLRKVAYKNFREKTGKR